MAKQTGCIKSIISAPTCIPHAPPSAKSLLFFAGTTMEERLSRTSLVAPS
jgi:hypothetical protein